VTQKNISIIIYLNDIARKHKKDIPSYVFLCYDKDVFKRASKPPFDEEIKTYLDKINEIVKIYSGN